MADTALDSGYGTLLRNVAASIEVADPDAAQAVLRASVDVEEMVAELLRLRDVVGRVKASEVVELYGLRWAKDSHYYSAADALGIEEPPPGEERGGTGMSGDVALDCIRDEARDGWRILVRGVFTDLAGVPPPLDGASRNLVGAFLDVPAQVEPGAFFIGDHDAG